MKFVFPAIDHVFDVDNGQFHTLVIENQSLFSQLLQDIHQQMEGGDGQGVLSDADAPIAFSRYADVIDVFVPFSLNRKPLLSKISAALEREAVDEAHYEQSLQLLQAVETLLDDIAFRFPCDLVFPKLSIAGILKSAGIELKDDYKSIGERVIDYMELVTAFDRSKLFFTVNMRSFIADEEMALFVETALSHGFQLLSLESCDHPRLKNEARWTIDKDLCEFG